MTGELPWADTCKPLRVSCRQPSLLVTFSHSVATMASSNAERQARYRARQRDAGKLQLLLYATPGQARHIRAYLRGGVLPVTTNGAVSERPKPGKSRRRKKPQDPREALVRARRGDIQRWAGEGAKPTEIARRLAIEAASAPYLNGLLGSEPWWPTQRAF